MTEEDIRNALLVAKGAIVGGISGLLGYLVDVVHRGRGFKWVELVLFFFVAAFVGEVIQDFWPIADTGKPYPGMGGTIAICGSSGYAVFVAMQDGGLKIIKKAIDVILGRLK